MNKAKIDITNFWLGIISGALAAIIVYSVIVGLVYFNKKDKGLVEYVEKQQAIEVLREDYRNRDSTEFLEVPGVRGAVDGASVEFLRKRDEAVQRLRSRHPD
jgi:hypothetical protein